MLGSSGIKDFITVACLICLAKLTHYLVEQLASSSSVCQVTSSSIVLCADITLYLSSLINNFPVILRNWKNSSQATVGYDIRC